MLIVITSYILKSKRANGTVLKQDNGKQIEPRLMQMKFKKYTAECGIENINFHSLRHSFATRCVELGFDVKTLSEILGHSDVKTTLNRIRVIAPSIGKTALISGLFVTA